MKGKMKKKKNRKCTLTDYLCHMPFSSCHLICLPFVNRIYHSTDQDVLDRILHRKWIRYIFVQLCWIWS